MSFFQYQYPIVLGGFNDDILQTQNPHSQHVADLLMEFGLVDLFHHFRKRLLFRNLKTWY